MVASVNDFQKYITATQLNQKIGRFLRHQRLAVGLTGRELGGLLYLSQQQISRYEQGVSSITLHQLCAFMQVLEVSWERFTEEVMKDTADVGTCIVQYYRGLPLGGAKINRSISRGGY